MHKYIITSAFFILIGLSCIAEAQAREVPRWGMFEVSVRNTVEYANPFADVIFDGWVVSPSNRQSRVYGFYDGDDTWKFRFMPDETGTWRYILRFSDGTPGIEGSFSCTSSKLHGPIEVNPANPLWFQQADGKPFYMSSFHLWHIDMLDPEILDKTLDYLKSQGFNTVVSPHIIPEKQLPWMRGADNRIDFARFNLELWRDFDRVLTSMDKRGMVLIPFNVFGGTNGMPKIPTKSAEDLFLRYWTARWGGYWNATYQPTSEWEEAFSDTDVMRIGSRLQEFDNGRHLISIHGLKASSSTVQKADWYSYHTVQDKLEAWNPEKFTWLSDLFVNVRKPVFAHECLWEGNLYQKEAGLDMENMRRGAWFITLSGAQINYADEVIPPRRYQMRNETGEYYSVVGASMKPHGELYPSIKILNEFMRSIPFSRMTPQHSLSSTGVCLAEIGKTYVSYASKGGPMMINLSDASGSFNVRWMNPRTGEYGKSIRIKGGKTVELTAPDTNDWVLLIKKK
ncbi:MAG: DUF5060 domain-containing protein [Armatimonadota bacterium]